MLKAIVYGRVSTDEQAENGTSLETQELTCLRRAAALGAQVVGTFRDEGISGGLYLTRAGIQAALRELEAGRANLLIVANLSRFSRDAEHQQSIRKRIERAGARLILCDMEIADTPEGDLQFGIMGQFAQYERQLIRKRTMTGRRHRAEQGAQPCRSQSPIGYHVVTNAEALAGLYGGATPGSYVVLEDEARIVRELFRQFAAGESLRNVARWLVANGVSTRRGGATWYAGTVRKVLCNPVYKGEPAFGRMTWRTDEERTREGLSAQYQRPSAAGSWVTMHCEPIIDAVTWNTVQERLKENQELQGGPSAARYLLSGVMRCTKCGRGMCARWINRKNGGPRYYACPLAWKGMDVARRQCTPGLHRADQIEPATIRTILYLAHHPGVFKVALAAYHRMHAGTRSEDTATERTRLETELRDLTARETATARAQVDALMNGRSTDVYDRLLSEIHDQRQNCENQLSRVQAKTGAAEAEPDFDTDAARVAEVLRRLAVVLTADDMLAPDQRKVLLAFVKAIRPLGPPAEGRYEMEVRGVHGSVYSIKTHYPPIGIPTETYEALSERARQLFRFENIGGPLTNLAPR